MLQLYEENERLQLINKIDEVLGRVMSKKKNCKLQIIGNFFLNYNYLY